jgi:hypothetical protein
MGNGWESIKGYVDCENFEIIEWDEETQEIYNAVCTIHSPCFPTCDGCSSKVAYLPAPVPTTPAAPTPTSLLHTQLVSLTQGDVDILNGSVNRKVRVDVYEDGEVKRLYEIWRSL